jgi:hypothetical protein
MLKPDDPVWTELIADIEAVASGRYAEDLDVIFGPTYAPSVEEPGFEFGVLDRKDRQNLLADMVDWRQYECQGMGHSQQRIVIANVLDGQPQEKWLEGIFDEAVLESEKIASFKAFVAMMKYSPDNHVFEEMDGDRLPWDDLSAAAKLQYIARDAVISDVPFEPFAQVVKDTIGEVGEAALRVVLAGQKELHAIEKLFPDDEQVKGLLDYVSVLESRPMPEEITSQQLRAILSPPDAADFWWCQGLAPPWQAEDKERHQHTEPKDHGKSENQPSREEQGTTDTERKLIWMETIRRLDAAYTVGGVDALAKMNGIEIHVLYAEKMAELEAVRKSLAEHGDNEISQMHTQKLERQTTDMAAWMRVNCPDFREMEQKAAKTSLAELKAESRGKQRAQAKSRDRDMER